MKRVQTHIAQTVLDDTRRFVINIFLPSEGPAQVRSCEISASQCRNRTSFSDARGIEEVFTPAIAEGMRALLAQLSASARVISLPEKCLEISGLLLAGIHLMSTYAKDGSALITMRFKHLIGSIHHAFLDVLNLSTPASKTCDHLALQVISDISMPLLDICAFADLEGTPAQEADSPYFQSIIARAGEIRFQVELIKRYIHRLDADMLTLAGPDYPLLQDKAGRPGIA